MPIDYYIDHARRLVVAKGRGIFTDTDVFVYQREVWSKPEVFGYNELVDMTEIEEIAVPVPAGPLMQQLASEAAAQDDPINGGRFAIVATSSVAFGLARQYQTHRELQSRGTKQVRVFSTLSEALSFLGVEDLAPPRPK